MIRNRNLVVFGRMKSNIGAIFVVILLHLSSAEFVSAQPSSVAGDGFLLTATYGTYPFGTGYYLFIPANSANTFQLIGIYAVSGSSGTYSYALTGPSAAVLNVNDSAVGVVTVDTSFATTDSGTFYLYENANPSSYQEGNFNFASANAPAS